MKRCPECRRDYYDDTLLYCLDDGNALLEGPASGGVPVIGSGPEPPASASDQFDEPQTAILHETAPPSEAATRAQINTTDQTAVLPCSAADIPKAKGFDKRLLLAPLALAVIALGGFFGYRYFLSSNSKQIESLAVMPFVNDSGNPEIEYLSDGMTETLITSLSQIPSLKVKARSAVFRYKGKDTDPRTVAKDLGVQALLTGHVLQRGDQLSIRLELIDAATEDVLWADKFDRPTSEILSLQNDIARNVLAKVKAKLSGADEERLKKLPTTNSDAYQFYVKGRYFWNKRGADNIKKAAEQFKLATAADPNFALAFAGLADCYAILGDYENVPADVLGQAREYAERAIAIDDQLAEPHATLAILNMQKFRWDEAEQEGRRAVDLDPNYPTGVQWYASILLDLDRPDEAIVQYQRAYELDPLSGAINDGLVNGYQGRGDHKRAVEVAEKFIALDPTFPGIYADLGLSYLMLGRNDDAAKAAEKAAELSGRESWALGKLGFVYASVGKKKEALALLEELRTRAEKSGSYGRFVAAIYAGLGDVDHAFEWLRKDFEHSSGRVLEVRWDVPYTEMRKDPRFKEIMKRATVPE
ncbi:MAG: tetratricopeptide repeat protein [Pyrinomonadaceae bacterium]